MRAALVATAPARLEERSPSDSLCGTGRNGRGRNLHGLALMRARVRDLYVAAAAPPP